VETKKNISIYKQLNLDREQKSCLKRVVSTDQVNLKKYIFFKTWLSYFFLLERGKESYRNKYWTVLAKIKIFGFLEGDGGRHGFQTKNLDP
jgi:hypothetical protein